jgi:hypothetical protein
LSDGALEWMLGKVAPLGLSVDTNNVEYGTSNSDIEYGVNPKYDAPFVSPKSILGYKTRKFPGIITFANLHASVIKCWKDKACNYRPENLKQKFGAQIDGSS